MQRASLRTPALTGLCLCLLASVVALGAETGNVDLPRFPSISPDGEAIVFSWRGDLWKVGAGGGDAVRLTSHPANETRSAWSPDGATIAFNSNRNGFGGIYLMNADGTGIRAVTDTDQNCTLTAFARDRHGKEVLTFDSSLEADVYRSPRPFWIDLEGGDMLRVHDAFGRNAVPSPDGKAVVFTRGGSNWRRRHYRGADTRDVWLYQPRGEKFTRLTDWEGNDGMARWADDDTLIFASDRELKRVNLYRMDPDGGSVRALTSFEDRDIQSFDVAADGSSAVLMAWDTLYTLDLGGPGAEPVALTIRANEDERDRFEIKEIGREVSESALSPDGKVMAYVAYGEVYVRNLDKKSPTRRVTSDHARQKDLAWSPDGVKLYFADDRDGTDSIYAATVALSRDEIKEAFDAQVNPQPEAKDEPEEGDEDKEKENGKGKKGDEPKPYERWHTAVTFDVEPVVQESTNDASPSPSLDGKSLAFQRGRGDLMILDLESGETRSLVTGWDTGLHWSWSPDSRHIAYAQSDLDFNRDIWIAPADGSAPAVNITRHPDNEMLPRWSADGRILAFVSERIDEEYDVWMVYLDDELEAYTPQELAEYYKDAAEAAKKRKPLPVKADDDEGAKDEKKKKAKTEEEPLELKLDDAYLRLRRVTSLSGSEFDLQITPGGDRYVFTATVGEPGLFVVRWDGEERKKIAGEVDVQQLSLTGDKAVVVQAGQAGTVSLGGEPLEIHDISDKMRIDLEEQSSQKFLEAARTLGEVFYHPTMKGLDWSELTRQYHELARKARTADEFNDVANRFLGELNASHLGIYAGDAPSPNAQSQGRLGTRHRRNDDGFEVLQVLPESPAAKGSMALEPGDVIVAVQEMPFGPAETLESRLTGRTGEETLLTIRRRVDGESADLNVLITPIGWRDERQIKYRHWRRENARRVEEWSKGRIGYIHIQAMNQPSLDVFERDLYAAAADKEGLLIDVRNNGGGWTTDRLLASIMVQQHAYTIPRGADPKAVGHYPQDRLFIQRYTLPINMLCNEKSFSNAEIISHAFKALERGTLVGQETYGAVISTGGMQLIDGTFVRLPFRGWYLNDGTDMEDTGAVPDIIVPQTPEAESAGDDEQLKAALEDLLGRL